MTRDRDTHTMLNSSACKRLRPDDSADTLLIEPPAKVSRTDSGSIRHHGEGEMDSGDCVIASVELDDVKKSMKHSNILAFCSPQSIGQIMNDIISWSAEEQNLHGSMVVVVADDATAMESYQTAALRTLPMAQICSTVNYEHGPPNLGSSNNVGKNVVFVCPEQFLQMSSREGPAKSQNCSLIVYDTTMPVTKGHNILLEKILFDCCSYESFSLQPRILVLLRNAQGDSPPDSGVAWLKSASNAMTVRIVDTKNEQLPPRSSPMELVIAYNASTYTQETLLCQKLREYNTKTLSLDRHFRNANLALYDLGPCAADLVWRDAFGFSDGTREGVYVSQPGDCAPEARARDFVKHWPFKLPNLDFTSRNMNVSHKFVRLIQLMEVYRAHGDKFRGIVFVQKRIIAQLLVALFQSLTARLQFLRPVALTNRRLSSNYNTLAPLFRQFNSGQSNLLVVTTSFVDVDLPKASLVVLFDVFESQVFRAYSRSCAASQESHLIHMVERDNNAHRHALSRTAFNSEMLRWADKIGHDSPGSVPPQPLRESSHSYTSDSEDDGDSGTVRDPITGSHMGKHQATAGFYRFVAQIGTQDCSSNPQRLFNFLSDDVTHGWRCTIRLTGTPVDGISSMVSASKSLARREACYLACQRLQHLGQLDSTFFPHDRSKTTEFRDDRVDQQLEPSHERPHMPLTPDFWKNSVSTPPFPQFLYPSVVLTLFPGSGLHERAPICILTRAPLPDIPHFQLSQFGDIITLQFRRDFPLSLDSERLELVRKFTIKFCRIIMNKPFESSSFTEMGYLFAPLKRNWRPPAETAPKLASNLFVDIDWGMISLVSETWALPFADLTRLRKDAEDAVLQDRAVEFTHRCEILRIREDMTPLTEVLDEPQGYSLLKYAAFAADERFSQGGRTLLEQCHGRRKNFEGLRDPNQPVLEVTRMPAAANCLNSRISSHVEAPEKAVQFLIPEYSRKLTVPASTLRMGYLLPSIMRKVDDFLLIKQLNAKILDHCVRDDLLLMATASPLAGYDYDYERLELLGDAFLKYLSSTYVFVQDPDGTEGELHTARQRYISNQQLFHVASRLGLPPYIQLKPSNIKTWVPPGMRLADTREDSTVAGGTDRESNLAAPQITTPGQANESSLGSSGAEKRFKNRKKRSKKSAPLSPIANKTVADVAEAIMGAAYISGGRDAALKATKALMIPFVGVEEWCDFERKVQIPRLNAGCEPEPSVVASIEEVIGHRFRKPSLLYLALTHVGLNSMEMKDHQRLEFLGDAVLDFLAVHYLYDKNQEASPGDLSVLKSMMVSNSILAAICVWCGLHKFIHTTTQLGQIILDYEKILGVQEALETSLAREEGRRIRHYWRDLDAPKVLSDVVESIIGAAYISDGFSQTGVEAIFGKLLLPFYERYIPPQPSHLLSGVPPPSNTKTA